tara:strand:- start:14252 stop:15145 length:894 start_codon:yes stop_codon:yes gene_type:complete
MTNAVYKSFEVDHGFQSPGFQVDAQGNIVARSIITTINEDAENIIVDYTITDNGTAFFLASFIDINPTITMYRGNTYKFRLNLTSFGLYIKKEDQETNQNSGLVHSSSVYGEDAQGLNTGILSFTVPLDSEDILYYSNELGTAQGTINVFDPIGLFNNITITGGTASTSPLTGTLVVDGGIGLTGNAFVTGSISSNALIATSLISQSSLTVGASNTIEVTINDITLGTINSTGLAIPINNSNITASNINGTIIGSITPSTGTFTSASVQDAPINLLDITNKTYVDSTATALSIALGI